MPQNRGDLRRRVIFQLRLQRAGVGMAVDRAGGSRRPTSPVLARLVTVSLVRAGCPDVAFSGGRSRREK
jgi:hypothetical protein